MNVVDLIPDRVWWSVLLNNDAQYHSTIVPWQKDMRKPNSSRSNNLIFVSFLLKHCARLVFLFSLLSFLNHELIDICSFTELFCLNWSQSLLIFIDSSRTIFDLTLAIRTAKSDFEQSEPSLLTTLTPETCSLWPSKVRRLRCL